MNEEKRQYIKQLCNEDGVIGALAIDQRGALKKMITKFKGSEAEESEIVEDGLDEVEKEMEEENE